MCNENHVRRIVLYGPGAVQDRTALAVDSGCLLVR